MCSLGCLRRAEGSVSPEGTHHGHVAEHEEGALDEARGANQASALERVQSRTFRAELAGLAQGLQLLWVGPALRRREAVVGGRTRVSAKGLRVDAIDGLGEAEDIVRVTVRDALLQHFSSYSKR